MMRKIFVIGTLIFGFAVSAAQSRATIDRAVDFLQKHSYYIPVYTDSAIYMVENYDVFGLFISTYELSRQDYLHLMKFYVSNEVPLPSAISRNCPINGYKVEKTQIEMEDKTELVAKYTNGRAFNYPLPENIGEVLYALFIYNVLVATDCVTGILCVEPYASDDIDSYQAK